MPCGRVVPLKVAGGSLAWVLGEDEGSLGKMLSSKLSDVRAQVEAKKAVPKEEHPSGRVLDSSNPQRTKKIFVGGLAPSVDENVLKGYFERFGEVRRHPGAAETFTEISSR